MHTFQKHAWKIEKAVYCYNDVIAKTKQIPPAAHLLSSSKILSNQILQSKHKIFSSFKSLTIGEFLKHCMFKEKDTLFWIPWNLLKTSLCTKFPFLGSSHANFKKKKRWIIQTTKNGHFCLWKERQARSSNQLTASQVVTENSITKCLISNDKSCLLSSRSFFLR